MSRSNGAEEALRLAGTEKRGAFKPKIEISVACVGAREPSAAAPRHAAPRRFSGQRQRITAHVIIIIIGTGDFSRAGADLTITIVIRKRGTKMGKKRPPDCTLVARYYVRARVPIVRVYRFPAFCEKRARDCLAITQRKREVCLLYKFATARFFLSRNITHTQRTHFPCLIAAFLRHASGRIGRPSYILVALLLALKITVFCITGKKHLWVDYH